MLVFSREVYLKKGINMYFHRLAIYDMHLITSLLIVSIANERYVSYLSLSAIFYSQR